MKEKFKDLLKSEGRSLKWFYDVYVMNRLCITYVYMTAQLNGFNTLTEELENLISEYMDNHVKTQGSKV